MNYETFINQKTHLAGEHGFDPLFMPDQSFDFQKHLIEWSVCKGRAAIFADCGLGKTLMQLAFAENVIRHTNKPVLVLTPLAVGAQTVKEASKFGMDAIQCRDGKHSGKAQIVVTNYERLHYFNREDFAGVVCDESGILKNHSGATRNEVLEFAKSIPYRLLATATPAPNDITELGNSVEALSIMRRVDMLARFFVHDSSDTGKWRIKGHAVDAFWQFVASWARAIRHPKDMGFDQRGYDLPPMDIQEHILPSKPLEGFLFPLEARTLDEQRSERKITISERCEMVANIANSDPSQFTAWCSYNDESAMLKQMIDGAIELSGSDSDEEKEEKIMAFAAGEIKAMVTKPKICSHGINWQSCHRMSFFPSHSHEQFYQAVRRFWRFGQSKTVQVHVVTTESESRVVANLKKKEFEAEVMFREITANMSKFQTYKHETHNPQQSIILPSWLK
jgi:superfamily II DNA or RNA helicase